MTDRIGTTDAALALIDKLVGVHGPLMFYQGGGCCDGSAPNCFLRGEFKLGSSDVHIGEIGGQPYYISGPQFEYYRHSYLTIDIVKGGGGGFSLEAPEGVAFISHSRLFTDAEVAELAQVPLFNGEGEPIRTPAAA